MISKGTMPANMLSVSRFFLFVVLWSGAGGCAEATEEATLRDALPTLGALTFPVPGTDAGDGEEADGARVEPLLGQRAVLYRATRDTAFVVNGSVLLAMVVLQLVVALPPSQLNDRAARWGPITDRAGELAYELEVEAAGLALGSDARRFRFVLRGGLPDQPVWEFVDLLSGETELGSTVRRGTIGFDFDAFASLRPGEPSATGRVAARWDTGAYLERVGPRRLDVTFDRFAASADSSVLNATYRFEQGAPREGRLALETEFDLVPTTALRERVTMVSRWNERGGRSDARAAGGDLGLLSFGLVECWGPAFGRTFYRDTADAAPAEGAETACVFLDSDAPRWPRAHR